MSQKRAQFSFLRSLRRLRAAFWRRRVAHWLIRTAWLVLLVPTLCMAGYLWLDWQVRWYDWLLPMLVVGLLSLLWAIRPISLKKIVYRLDSRLGLRTQLITAFEVGQTDQDPTDSNNLVSERLLAETVEIIINFRQQISTFNRHFWLETHTLIGIAALLGAMLTLDALSPRIPEATSVSLPTPVPEPLADEVIPPDAQLFPPPFPPQLQAQALSGPQIEQALEALADALRDQAVTRSVAEAIDRGDLSEAAENLRRLADQLGDLSGEARSELSDALQEAADNIGENGPSLTPPLEAGNEALDENDLRNAGQALSELAEALESLEDPPQESAQAPPEEAQPEAESQPGQPEQAPQEEQPQAEPAEQPSESGEGPGPGDGPGEGTDQPTEEERLAVEGQPLELENEPDLIDEDLVLQPAELDAQAGDRQTEDSPFARGSANTATDLGPDPLTYPWNQREVVRRYFTP